MRQAAVASIAAAAALSAAPAAAQDFTPTEDDAVLLQLQVRTYRLLDEIRGYQTPGGGVCVDLADMIQSLDMPIRLDKKSRRATGWTFAEDRTLTVDRDSNTVQIVNNKRPLQPGELYDTPEGWCVDTDALSGWFGVSFTANVRNSVLTLESEQPLPFIEAIERKSRAARLRPAQDNDLAAYPRADQPYALWRAPSVDVVAESTYRRGDSGGGRLDRRYEIFASGEAALASFDLRLASNTKGVPQTLRVRAFRMDPEGTMLGPLRATQLVAGDVDMPSGDLAGGAGVGRGLFVSNTPLHRPTRFGSTVLRGVLPLGWDAELYRNGQLLAFQNEGLDGRYEFEVPLVYGNNDLEVVLYGPQGQVRHETQSIPVGYGAVEPGRLEYWAGVIERNRDLITFGQPPPGYRLERGWQYGAGAQYGLDSRTVVGASGHSLFYLGRRRDYAEFNLERSLGRMLLNLTASQEFGRGRAYRLDLIGDLGPIGVQAESFFVDGGYTSVLVAPLESSAHRVQFDSVVQAGRVPIPLSAGFRRTTQRDGKNVNEILARASLMLPRVSLTGFVLHRKTEGGLDEEEDPEDGTRVGLLANTRLLGLSVRGEATYRLSGPEQGFEAATVTAETSLDEHSELRLDVEHRGRSDVTEFELGYIRHFRQFSLRGSAAVDTHGAIAGSLALSFSFGRDPLGGGWRMSDEKLAQRGHAAVSVFLDENGDGRRSAGEQALEGVGVTAGQFGSSQPTDERGHTYVEGLQPYEQVLVSLDESTLPDPFLVPRGKGLVVTPRPGIATVVELAVSPTGEVEGEVVSSEERPVPGVEFELVGPDGRVAARAMSDYDGFFLFERVPYGRYRLQLSKDSELALGPAGELAAGIELGPDRTIERLGTIRLRERTVVAQARGPPSGGSP
ncbi:MAG TPA: carboxypeptidase-like regulatory domain-containing protein [Croceibacterium sp.]